MQAKKSIVSLAIVSLFAAAGAAFAYGPGPQGGGMRMGGPPADAAQHAERMQLRLSTLKEALKLQPNQLDAWNAYEAKVKAEGQVRFEMRQAMHQQTDAQALADQRVAMMKHRAQAAEEINTLRKALVATLTPEQKATFDQYSMGPHMRGGRGAEGGMPGVGPGPAGRGPGYGRS
jgi:1,2-phenylacetyl-CoA epoxidase PaaB subunit